jgi:hypothetical protein
VTSSPRSRSIGAHEARALPGHFDIKMRPEASAVIARVIISGKWCPTVLHASCLLSKIAKRWPSGRRVKFLMTCGGFVNFLWPDAGSDEATPPDLNALIDIAKRTCAEILTPSLRKRLGKTTRFLTLGIDSQSNQRWPTMAPHVELVAVIDLKTNCYHWTEKSYPTVDQERNLIAFDDLSSHFKILDRQRVLILGCHDLNFFNPRAWALARGNRQRKSLRFRALAKKQRPTVVLHHPHTADTHLSWSTAWGGLRRTLPSVQTYAGAGRHYRKARPPRKAIDNVLAHTKCGEVMEIIVRMRRRRQPFRT